MLCFAVIPVGDGRPIADRRVLNWRAALAAGRGLTLFTLLLLFDDVLVTFWRRQQQQHGMFYYYYIYWH